MILSEKEQKDLLDLLADHRETIANQANTIAKQKAELKTVKYNLNLLTRIFSSIKGVISSW